MKIVDARGKTCPQPLILTKNEVDKGENNITTIVDNETSKANVIKFGVKSGYNHEEEIKEDGIYIKLTKTNLVAQSEETIQYDKVYDRGMVYVFGRDVLGAGSDQLGRLLMKNFIFTISQTKPYPDYMIFLNGGVNLTVEGSESLEDIKKLETGGVKIVSCGTCLDFFEIKTKLAVGQISNMYDIVEAINNSRNVMMI